jgi:hypothetical protein
LTTTAATCELWRNAAAIVVIADPDLTERAACAECWHKTERAMDVKVIRFAGPYGTRSRVVP